MKWEINVTYSKGRVGSQFQETCDGRYAQVGRRDVQSGAEVKVTAGGIDLYMNTFTEGK